MDLICFLSIHSVLLFLTAFFKIHFIVEFDAIIRKSHQIVILENEFGSVVAIDQRNDTVIAKVPDFVAVLGKRDHCLLDLFG